MVSATSEIARKSIIDQRNTSGVASKQSSFQKKITDVGGTRNLTERLDRGIKDLYGGLFVAGSLSLTNTVLGATGSLSQAAVGMTGSGVSALSNLIGYNPCWEGHELTWNAWSNKKRNDAIDSQAEAVAKIVLEGSEEQGTEKENEIKQAYKNERYYKFSKSTIKNSNLKDSEKETFYKCIHFYRNEIQQKSYIDKQYMRLTGDILPFKSRSADTGAGLVLAARSQEGFDNFRKAIKQEAMGRGLFHAWTVASAYFVTITAAVGSAATNAAMWTKATKEGLSTFSEIQAAGGSVANIANAAPILSSVVGTLSCLANADAAMLHRNALNLAKNRIKELESKIPNIKEGLELDDSLKWFANGFSDPIQSLSKSSLNRTKENAASGFESEYGAVIDAIEKEPNGEKTKLKKLLDAQKELVMQKLNKRGANRRWYRSTLMSIAGAANTAGSVCIASGVGAPFAIPLFGGGLLLTFAAFSAGSMASNNNKTMARYNQIIEKVEIGNLKKKELKDKVKKQFEELAIIATNHVKAVNKKSQLSNASYKLEGIDLANDQSFNNKINKLEELRLDKGLLETLKNVRALYSSFEAPNTAASSFNSSERSDYWSKFLRVPARKLNRAWGTNEVSLSSPNQRKLENARRILERCRTTLVKLNEPENTPERASA